LFWKEHKEVFTLVKKMPNQQLFLPIRIQFSGVADSFLTQTPSVYFLETLTASSFLRTNYQQVDELMRKVPAIQTMVLKATSFA
jgi:hypothetical protein